MQHDERRLVVEFEQAAFEVSGAGLSNLAVGNPCTLACAHTREEPISSAIIVQKSAVLASMPSAAAQDTSALIRTGSRPAAKGSLGRFGHAQGIFDTGGCCGAHHLLAQRIDPQAGVASPRAAPVRGFSSTTRSPRHATKCCTLLTRSPAWVAVVKRLAQLAIVIVLLHRFELLPVWARRQNIS